MGSFTTPAGRLVQGSVTMQHQKDMQTNQPKFNADGTPEMAVFFSLAFPKIIPGQNGNPEFDAFFGQLRQEAAAAWPSQFPQGPNVNPINPKFSWKYQDGDGTNDSGQPVSGKPGFAGHHIIKFYSAYPVKCFMDGQFSAHQELQKPEETIQRGDWVRVVGEFRSNNATGTQVPGMAIYPSLVSYIGRDPAGRITSGPDAATAFGAAHTGYVPPGVSAHPAAQGGSVPGGIVVPGVASTAPAGGAPNVAVPGVGGAPGAGVPGGIKVAVPGVGGAPGAGVPGGIPGVVVPGAGAAVAAEPVYAVAPQWAAQGVTLDGILAQGFTKEVAAAQGYLVRLS